MLLKNKDIVGTIWRWKYFIMCEYDDYNADKHTDRHI